MDKKTLPQKVKDKPEINQLDIKETIAKNKEIIEKNREMLRKNVTTS